MRISVITVVYNNVDQIAGTIKSVLAQDYPFIEYIIIDGGSTDGTLDVIKDYCDSISVFFSGEDQGIYDALNKGVSLATGDIIGFLHSGDIFSGHGVVSSVAQCFENANLDVVYGDLVYVSPDDVGKVVRYWKAGSYSRKKLSLGWMPPHPTVYARRDIYQRVGLFDLSYRIASDYDYMLRMFTDNSIFVEYLPEVLVKMRLGGVSNTGASNILRKSIDDYRAMKKNQVGGMLSLFFKNFSKISQFFMRERNI